MPEVIQGVNKPIVVVEPTSGYVQTTPLRPIAHPQDKAETYVPPINPATPTRPVLDPPDQKSEIKLQSFAESIVAFMNLLTDIEHLYVNQIEVDMKERQGTMVKRLSKHHEEQREIGNSIESASWWDSIRLFSLVALGAVSMVVGGAVISAAATTFELITGSGLLLSGGMTVASNALLQSNSHPDLANALAISGATIGLIAGTAHMLTATQTFGTFAYNLAIAALGVSSNLATMGREEWLRVAENLRAKNALTQKELEMLQFLMDVMSKDAPHFIEFLAQNEEEVSKIQARHEQNMRRIIAYSGPLSAA